MILITKDECIKVRKRYPRVQITRTCIQKSKRHRYYMPESPELLRVISDTNSVALQLLNGLRKYSRIGEL